MKLKGGRAKACRTSADTVSATPSMYIEKVSDVPHFTSEEIDLDVK